MRKKKAPAQAPVQPVAVEIMAQLPDELREMLQKEQIRTLEDVTDVSAMFTRLVAEQVLPTRISKEVRLWTELLFSAVAAKNATPQNEINVIGQLIQAVGGTPMQAVGGAPTTPLQVDEIIDMETIARPRKKVINGR